MKLYLLPHLGTYADIPEVLAYGPLSRALIAESEIAVIKLLSESQTHLQELNNLGQTPLHVSACWPKGLELIFHLAHEPALAKLEFTDRFHRTALDYARAIRNPHSVEELLRHGARLDLEDTFNIELLPTSLWSAQSSSVISILCYRLAQQRKGLCKLALEMLSLTEIGQFGLKPGQLVQDRADEIAQVINIRSNTFPGRYVPIQPGSVYHLSCMSALLVEALYQAGFDNTNTLFHGFSPLMTASLDCLNMRRGLTGTVDLVAWHLQHGGDLCTPIPPSAIWCGSAEMPIGNNFQVRHRVAYYIGVAVTNNPLATTISRDSFATISTVLSDQAVDSCRCYCSAFSIGGCTTACLFARGVLHGPWVHECLFLPQLPSRGREFSYLLKFMDQLLESGSKPVRKDRAESVAMLILRVFTFERLGMKHTCCMYVSDLHVGLSVTQRILKNSYRVLEVMDPDEILEIQDEDTELCERLDHLMDEFERKFFEIPTPFSQFVEDYWRPRMDEVDGPWSSFVA